ncbi:MAG TPA: signal recognition particle-docking protein FtsY [Burkholderiales bacterium]|nr:signal recognition particle-docking protein FtsY [Burkholderiales bacterium]
MFSFLKQDQNTRTEDAANWAARLKQNLSRTRNQLGGQLANLLRSGKIDETLYQELEHTLLSGDVGAAATEYLLEMLRARAKRENLQRAEELQAVLRQCLLDLLAPLGKPVDIGAIRPFIIMLAGVNGSGKTTSIGKLARYFQKQGKSVVLAAGDTFRAAAREQLQAWGASGSVTVISQERGDPGAVIFDAIHAAKARSIDIVLADTAGRLPTQLHLMEEIKKVKRVIAKAEPSAPHEILLVLDANTGQNMVNQVKAFDDALGLTGLIITKLDGSAKGGALAAIARARPVAVRFIGIGEKPDDLRPFDAVEFVETVLA